MRNRNLWLRKRIQARRRRRARLLKMLSQRSGQFGGPFQELRLRRLEEALAFRTEWLEAILEEIHSYVSQESEDMTTSSGSAKDKTTSLPVVETDEDQEDEVSETAAPKDTRLEILFDIFDEIKGKPDNFLPNGRPNLKSVNDHLQALGESKATRKEIDRAFEKWK